MAQLGNIEKLNKDIEKFGQVFPVTEDMKMTHEGVSRIIMLDRYAYTDKKQETLGAGDLVVFTVKTDPTYPVRGTGIVQAVNRDKGVAIIDVDEQYVGNLEGQEAQTGIAIRPLDLVDKPLEVFYEQIVKRNAKGLADASVEENKEEAQKAFEKMLGNLDFIPAGRVIYGAGSEQDVTYFNCFVLPFPQDSREGLAIHRQRAMEIMSRGGGVGTNGSTLRPRNTLARGVNGKSSGSVSWLDDLSKLTHLVEQGGSRRGAQMIMLADWHPDILEFIISKMQNPRILRYLIENIEDEEVIQLAKDKLKLKPLTSTETDMYKGITKLANQGVFSEATVRDARQKLKDGGTYTVNNPDFLSGANISVAITDDFMQAVENDEMYTFRFPDVENYSEEHMVDYNEKWHEVGDVREWEDMGYATRDYRSISAKELWKLISICATYSAEPGIFFIDNANNDTNAQAYGGRIVATNPCGEQPLTGFAVCNLSAVNLANFVDKTTGEVLHERLAETVKTGVRMQDNVINATPYFMEENKTEALGERRIGLGVMGLADMLIYARKRYGSEEGNEIVDKVFETIAVSAYEASIELAKTRGSFPYLIGETEEETQELREKFINSGYMKRMPEHIRQGVLEHGIRNSHLLTVAPTGSTGSMVGVGTGLEPYFAFKYYRSGRLGKFMEVNADIVQEYLDANPEADGDNLPDYFVSAMELSPEEHVDVQTTIQRWVDSSISKTVNAPKGYTVEQVQKVYERLYKGGAKGGTVYVDGSRDTQVLTLKAEENDMENSDEPARVVEDVEELRQLVNQAEEEHVNNNGHTDDVVYGSEIGDTCPACRIGAIKDIAGCNTCTNCNIQLKCGL